VRTALDTNVLSELLSLEAVDSKISIQLAECKSAGPLIISAVVYAELLAHPKITEPFLAYLLSRTGIEVDYGLSEKIWKEAGRRYAFHAARRRTTTLGGPRRILADFIIGAHALHRADRLMTFDVSLFRRDFPELPLQEGHTS
jgi:predicted nucleic acid-binding protein